jgi:catechol 2,3-dioxygenase-like lactoylglutathione lyase family enzyme
MTAAVRQLLMCTATTPDLDGTTKEWVDVSGYELVERHPVGGMASLWGVESSSHHEAVVTRVPGTDHGYLRFIDTAHVENRQMAVETVGPFGFEFFAQDVDAVYERLRTGNAIHAIVPPRTYDLTGIGSGHCRSMAFRAPGDNWFFVTTMLWVPPPRELPTTPHFMAPVGNMPVAMTAREPAMALYNELLGITVRFDGPVTDPEVNALMDMPADWEFRDTVFFIVDGQLSDHHLHPSDRLLADRTPPGVLRSGPCIESFLVDGLDEFVEKAGERGFIVRGPVRADAAPYGGRRVATIAGPNGELIELVGD